ncbi:cysteine hydrolase family protein [Streptomyces sp. 549]|uniref:cysteine hydrolase family protein n=1 Tax=Streptomyces sp. 549 TaxID=3049076 RepID=UPI0024C26148|nr:cysteine hydrolase family protein [Streptomyces sp. 549]MDK1477078.1 cysteine hydrolase family protein [Streptomyces sp. 549]
MQTLTALRTAGNAALVVVDVQKGFDDPVNDSRGRSNPDAERNIKDLLDRWQATGRPVVFARHTSLARDSFLRAGQVGNDFQDFVQERLGRGAGPELVVDKTVNSAFIGTPDLRDWLERAGVRQVVVVGIQTNGCVETTARMGGNLGFDVVVPLDATYTFAETGPDGERLSAEEITRATAVNLHALGFARVVRTADVLTSTDTAQADATQAEGRHAGRPDAAVPGGGSRG